MYKILFLLTYISSFCNEGLTAQDNRAEALESLKDGALVVRMFNMSASANEYKRLSESNSVSSGLREKMKRKYDKIYMEHDSFSRSLIKVFKDTYSFSRVVFVQGDRFDEFQQGVRDSIFLDENLDYVTLDFEIDDQYVYTYRAAWDFIYHVRNSKNEKIKDFISSTKYYTEINFKTASLVLRGKNKRYDESHLNGIKNAIHFLQRQLYNY